MALLKELENKGNKRTATSGYWIVESTRYDKQSGKTEIDVGGYENQATRTAMFPTAEDRRHISAPGSLDVAACYDYLKSDVTEFEGASDA